MPDNNTATPIDPVDPELAAAGALLRDNGLIVPDPRVAPIGQVREMQDRIGAYLAARTAPVATERDVTIPGGAGELTARLYLPHSDKPPPLLVYFHGGGFAYGSAKAWDGLMRDLVHGSGVAVLNVDYRLAPEHKFPAGLDDAIAAISHAATMGEAWGIDATRLAAGGDSAGANLALVAAMSLRSANAKLLKSLLLFYGVSSGDADSPSWRQLGTGAYGLSQVQMEWVWSTYLAQPESRRGWRAAPLAGDLSSLPPVQQIIGSLDPLIDDARALKAKLDAAGVANDLKVYPGVNHGFVRFNRMIGQAQRAVDDAANALRRDLGGGT